MALDGPEAEEPVASEHESDSEASSAFGVVPKQKSKDENQKANKKGKKDGIGGNSKDDPEKGQKLLARAEGVLQSLNMMTPLAIYMGKAKEADSCVTKAMDMASKLESSGSSAARTKGLVSDLGSASTTVSTNMVVLGALSEAAKAADALSRRKGLEELTESHLDTFTSLPADCINSVLADVGRKLIEDGLQMGGKT